MLPVVLLILSQHIPLRARSTALPRVVVSAAGGNMQGPVNCIETMSDVDWDDR